MAAAQIILTGISMAMSVAGGTAKFWEDGRQMDGGEFFSRTVAHAFGRSPLGEVGVEVAVGTAEREPVPLVRELLAITKPDALVLDPFLGGGTTAVAALETGRRCIGIELSEEYAAIAKDRCEKVRL